MNRVQRTAISLTALALSAGAQAATMLSIPKMAKAPVLDGVVSADEWKSAGEYNRFCERRCANVFQHGGRVLVGRDDENLYLAIRTQSSPFGLIRNVAYRPCNQEETFMDDSVEVVFFPDPSATRTTMTHYRVNFNGAYSCASKRDGAAVVWTPDGIRNASAEKDGWWTCELSVPLAAIGFDASQGVVRGLRVVRNWHNCDDAFGHQTTLGEDDAVFSAPTGATLLVFDDAAPAVQVRELGGDRGDERATTYPVVVNVHNPTAKPLDVRVFIAGHPEHSQPGLLEAPATLAAGESRDFRVDGPVLDEEPVDLVTRVVSGDGKKTYFSRHVVFKRNYRAYEWIRSAADLEKAKFSFAYFPSYNLLHATGDVSSIGKRPKPTCLTWFLLNGTGATLARTNTLAGADGKSEIFWSVPDLRRQTLESGCPDYTVVMVAEDVKDGIVRQPFKRYALKWEGNKLGLSDTVPPPFVKVKREKVGRESRATEELEKVSVVLREHIVDKKTGLWRQVTAAGKDLLARPMRLVAGEDGTGATGRTSGTGGTATSRKPSCASQLSCASHWDCDGLCDWRLTLPPGHYEPFSLEIPLKAAEARLMHACVDGLRENYAGVVPAGTGRVWDGTKAAGRRGIIGDYLPYVWVGGALRGIAVFGDNDKGWVLENQVEVKGGGGERKDSNSALQLQLSTSTHLPCQEIIREADGTVVIRLNLVQRAVDLTESRTIRIGFQATPVKPMVENWRGRDIGQLIGACMYCGAAPNGLEPLDETSAFLQKMGEARRTGKVDQAFLKDYLARANYAGESGSKVREECVGRLTRHYGAGFYHASRNYDPVKKGPKCPFTYYTNARGIELGCRACTTYADEWIRFEYGLPTHVFGRHDVRDYDLDPVASYRDYAMWCYRQMIASGACDYIYWDDVYPSGNYDLLPDSDAYLLPDGRIQPSNGVFNMRELVRRTAVMQVEQGFEHRFNWVHMTNTAMAPVSAFAGVHYDWEDGAELSTFQDRYGIETILASAIGRQFGNIVSMIGYIGRTDEANRRRLERCGTGVMLAFEFQWNRVEQWQKLNEKLTEWGYRRPETKVWNFWDEDVKFPVMIAGPRNAALAMAKKKVKGGGEGEGAEALVVVSDFGGGGTFEIRPDVAVLGLAPGWRAFDFETGAAVPVKDGVAVVSIRKHDFAVVELRADRF